MVHLIPQGRRSWSFSIGKVRINRYAVVGEIAIRFLSNLSQKASYLILNSRRYMLVNKIAFTFTALLYPRHIIHYPKLMP